jgi:NAD(P)-dependent dehydrogenase (short-subunit alcohol dehydrogenase family)
MRLKDKIALVTGAQQGIGAAAAIELAREGADIVVNWLDDEAAAAAVAGQVRALGRRAALVRGDVGTVAGAQGIVEDAYAAFGRLDVLINNAGIYPRTKFLELTEATWDITHSVNLKGSAFCGQAAAHKMILGKAGGSIINIASVAASGSVNGAHYAASKGGVISLTRGMALELAAYGIRVNAIAPGLVDTAQPRYGMTEEEIAASGASSPIGRVGSPTEIATVAVFLASDMSSYMTGEVVQANGGAYMA